MKRISTHFVYKRNTKDNRTFRISLSTAQKNTAMASMKREETQTQHEEEQPKSKRPKYPSDQNHHVSLNSADCDLSFNIEADGLTGHGLYEEGFAYCWSGARGTVGINDGKYYFGCRIVSDQPVKMEDTPTDQQNVCRIGISRGDDSVGNLGETEHSYSFGGTGKFSNAGKFVNYGEKFGIGDTIICLVDLESKPWGSIEFCKNGNRLGIAKQFDSSPTGLTLTDTSAFFPHVLLKNTVVKMQFSMEDGLIPIEGYKPWASAMKDEKAIVGPSLTSETDCEVIMMVGLPASGKSTWAEKWVKEHPEKRYVLLGTNLALDQMKVPGLLRKNNYGERFDKLMDRATGIFNTLLLRASKVPRNYIIDQTNVYKSARKRKLKPFAFYHKTAIVVFPRAEDLKLRAEKRFKEMGKDVPPEAVYEMLANFVLPMSKDMHRTDEYFDKVIFTDLNRSEAQRQLDEMKRALPPPSFEKSTSNHSAYSQRSYSTFQSNTGHANSIYPAPSVRAEVAAGCSWAAGPPEPAALPYTAHVNTGYTGYIQPAGEFGVQPYQTNVHGRYESPARPYQGNLNPVPVRYTYDNPPPREDLTRSGGYTRDSLSTLPYAYRPPLGNHDGTRPAFQSSFGSYGYKNPGSEGHFGPSYSEHQNPRAAYGDYPANLQHPGSKGHYVPSYSGHQNPRSYGDYPANLQHPGSERHYGPSYSEHQNPIAYGDYPANIQHPVPGDVAYRPPRYY
ncbi:uncharacterized protein LOC141592963 [Silene latifolia]|uniref:uncharacterized protein LOC141592963 n=1 Tax=Silene latifolia TaxID=37657 RepID=UPI003D77C376